MSIKLFGHRSMVTGATGFLGKYLVDELNNHMGVMSISSEWDLTDKKRTETLIKEGPDYIFHLAGYNGGIQFNLDRPSDIFYKNTVMGLNLISACINSKIKKIVSVVSSCAYPEYSYSQEQGVKGFVLENNEIMKEPDFLDGEPNDTVACHGYAKRNLQLMTKFAKKQYGLNAICVCPTTLYGPGDSFDPRRTKVMGGMIKRFVDAVKTQQKEVVVWGSGKPMREFLFVEDAAKLIVQSLLSYEDSNSPLNLGSGHELSIAGLAELVAKCAGYKGKIVFDKSKPDGQYRKRLDLTKMKKHFPDFVPTSLETGIMKTIEFLRKTEAKK